MIVVATGNSIVHLAMKGTHPCRWMLTHEGACRYTIHLPSSHPSAHLGERQKLDAHMISILIVLIAHHEAHVAQNALHGECGLAESNGHALFPIHGLPRGSCRGRRPYEDVRELNRDILYRLTLI